MSDLTIKNLRKSYDALEILKGINLEIKDKEFVVFVGPSGCGKSTLLRTIAGLESATSGSIYMDDKDITDAAPAKRDLAMVFQSYALYPHMSVRENMSFALKLAGIEKSEINRKVEEAAQILKLEPLLDRKPKALSGGQRQRVAIGRAIVRKPKIFLFDEPLSNLDAALRVNMRLELSRLHQELQATMLYVTHDQVEAMTLADKVVILNDGRIEQVGSPLELYEKPCNLFVAGFMGMPKMTFLEVTVTAIAEGNVTLKLLTGAEITLSRPGLNVQTGSQLTLGIRPEHTVLCNAGAGNLQASIEISEELGSESYVYVKTNANEAITVRIDGEQAVPKSGSLVGLNIAPGKCHLFDKQGIAI
ncbi:MAG: sn-glycerol-3-phosphate ABC transporter ATP-binding protein UgpC [Oceanospirillaceae bacterium]|nr:sn-glycerol-3-phosphate ABC transporter ATP-binding protein UgpC [Oceanospirillaceae bacterium]